MTTSNQVRTSENSNYMFVNIPCSGSSTDWTPKTTYDDGWQGGWTLRVPPLTWEYPKYPEPQQSYTSDSTGFALNIIKQELREEFEEMLRTTIQGIMESVVKMITLLPRRGEEMPMREGVFCICGNFIPKEKEEDECPFCGR